MKYLFGALAGLLWGGLAAVCSAAVSKHFMKQNTAPAMMAATMLRTLIDIAALAAVFLLRKVLPFSFEAALVGTAVALSLLMIVFAFRLARPDKPDQDQ